ncbi:Uncharacterized protein FKW44_024322 [Caligus rogercresseyi]|uniref:Uncharacterized protein n=1 Tax=Caligus rogercresseyi TaxID=217165 RepID=A0A7T8JTB6_CALRO|nr:Uncharacterized protein FKW44_024892 [Caligus rogercresseyi]QQP33080.1 Uncharacterized protein FKW44_024322 [Caligus rogercresseyi]
MASFRPADFWPSSSPDVNPLDLLLMLYGDPGGQEPTKPQHTSVEARKATINKEWDNIFGGLIKTSCAPFATY